MQNVKLNLLIAAVFLTCLSHTTALAFSDRAASPDPAPKSAKGGGKDRSSRPINIKADELKADNRGRVATFSGRVVARQDDLTIYSDRLVIHYGDGEDQVDRIEASGNVRILQQNRVGTGGHAIYESKEGKITLSINPKVVQDKDSVTGKVIVYYLDEERSQVTGGENSRVEAVIHPKSDGGRKKNADKKQP